MASAIDEVKSHLLVSNSHMHLVREDFAFYYHSADFKAFLIKNETNQTHLVLLLDCPITLDILNHDYSVYKLVTFPLPTPQSDSFYSLLSTDIRFLGFHRDSDQILQFSSDQLPIGEVWFLDETSLILVDKSRPTCASALLDGDLNQLKTLCFYGIHRVPYPHSVHRIEDNRFILTNITQLQLLCVPPNGSDITKHVINLQQFQSVHDFSFHCTYIAADEFKLTTDLTYCDQAHNIDSVVQVKFPVNLPYLTEYFSQQDLVNILVDTLSNDSLDVQVPKLALQHGAEWDALFAQQEKEVGR